jgi:hypothetical protein
MVTLLERRCRAAAVALARSSSSIASSMQLEPWQFGILPGSALGPATGSARSGAKGREEKRVQSLDWFLHAFRVGAVIGEEGTHANSQIYLHLHNI